MKENLEKLEKNYQWLCEEVKKFNLKPEQIVSNNRWKRKFLLSGKGV